MTDESADVPPILKSPKDTNAAIYLDPKDVQLSVARFADEAQSGEVWEPSLRTIGRVIAGWIIMLICGILSLVSLYAWLTYPHLHDMVGVTEKGAELEAYREYQSAWFGQIKDLLQLLVVSLFVPLFSTVVGYIFGRQMEAGS
jgi:hypothetical protein